MEDEDLIREMLAEKIRQLGNEVAEAGNGLRALEIAKAFAPDIVIADIKMPQMDGLHLLSELKKSSFQGPFIIVSGYDSFKYAQTALTYGAFSYLLKPVNDLDLQDTVMRAEKEVLETSRRKKEYSQNQEESKKYKEIAQNLFLADVLQGTEFDPADLKKQMEEAGIILNGTEYAVAALSIDHSSFKESASRDKIHSLMSELNRIVTELMEGKGVKTYPFFYRDEIAYLFQMNSHCTSNEVMRDLLTHAQKKACPRFKLITTIGLGPFVREISHIHDSYENARKLLLARTVSDHDQIFCYSDFNTNRKANILISIEVEHRLSNLFERRESEAILKEVKKLYSSVGNHEIDLCYFIDKLNFQLIYIIYRIMDHLGINLESEFGSEIQLNKQLNSLTDIKAIMNFYKKIVESCMAYLNQKLVSPEDFLMIKVKDYVLKHYCDEVNLNLVADHIHVSAPYLSKLFKEKFDQNFSEYLTSIRIEKAKELLHDDDLTIDQISTQCGFHNVKYFHKVFKKSTGHTPGVYKKCLGLSVKFR